jgi:hypothetical protein
MKTKQWVCTRGVLGKRSAFLLGITFWSAAAYAGSATGTVNAVQISNLDGAFLQLNISPTSNYEPGCPQPSWAFIPSSDPLYSSFLATTLAAKASGTTIAVSTSGCVAISGSQQPRIISIEYGTRMPGT